MTTPLNSKRSEINRLDSDLNRHIARTEDRFNTHAEHILNHHERISNLERDNGRYRDRAQKLENDNNTALVVTAAVAGTVGLAVVSPPAAGAVLTGAAAASAGYLAYRGGKVVRDNCTIL